MRMSFSANMEAATSYPGIATLIDFVDKKSLVVLRDGRNFIGYLRSFDQYGNLVLHNAIERIHVDDKYGDIPQGIFVIRGENVALLGEIDDSKNSGVNLTKVSGPEILLLQEQESQRIEAANRNKRKGLMTSDSRYVCLDPLQEDFF